MPDYWFLGCRLTTLHQLCKTETAKSKDRDVAGFHSSADISRSIVRRAETEIVRRVRETEL